MESNPGGEPRGFLAKLMAMLAGDGNRHNRQVKPVGASDVPDSIQNPDDRLFSTNSLLVGNPGSGEIPFEEEPTAVVWDTEAPTPQDESKATWPR